jgi:hypothetical protein
MKNKALPVVGALAVTGSICLCLFFYRDSRQVIVDMTADKVVAESILMENMQLSPQVIRSYDLYRPTTGKNDSVPVLIYRFSQHMCESCIQEDLAELLDFQRQNSKAAICVLPAYPNDRNNRILLKNMLHNFDFRNLSADSLCIPLSKEDGTEKRYFAVLNKNREIEMIFFPRRNHQDLTRLYFSAVKKMLNRQ